MLEPPPATGPLASVKVLELSHIMAGPTCGLMLADLGADVVKVERLPGGDSIRRIVPPEIAGESAAFLMMNRNKRGVAIDLKREGGAEVLRRLLQNADVLVENFREGSLDRLGFGYERLHQEHPGLIYCSLSGFGRTGPYAGHGGLDLIAQGMSGLMSITGEGPGRQPVKVGAPITDITAGVLAAMGILAAYVHRLQTGVGQFVDTSLFEAGIMHTYWQSAIYLASGMSPGPLGSAHPLMAPYQAFPTLDGWINVGAANQDTWLRLVTDLEAEELASDERFVDNAARMQHRGALVEALSDRFRRHTTADWLGRFEASGVPAGPVLSVAQVHDDPQTQARQMIGEVPHSRLGAMKTLNIPVKLSATPGNLRRGAPLLGEHTREVLLEAGYQNDEIELLVSEGAIAVSEEE